MYCFSHFTLLSKMLKNKPSENFINFISKDILAISKWTKGFFGSNKVKDFPYWTKFKGKFQFPIYTFFWNHVILKLYTSIPVSSNIETVFFNVIRGTSVLLFFNLQEITWYLKYFVLTKMFGNFIYSRIIYE